jgi:hypothetical protein
MRIWDVPPRELCRSHLLGEHRELHSLWSILTKHMSGFAHHPETLRWQGKLRALYHRHEQLVAEMHRRGYEHHTPLDIREATGSAVQDKLLQSLEEQKRILWRKHGFKREGEGPADPLAPYD